MSPRPPHATGASRALALLVAIALTLSAALYGTAPAGATEPARETLDPAPAAVADSSPLTAAPDRKPGKRPKVSLAMRKKRVTAEGHARVRVIVRKRASSSQTLRSGRLRIVVKGPGTTQRIPARLADHKAVVSLPSLERGVYRVRAVFLGNKWLHKAKSDYKELTVYAQYCAPPAFPDESCTGVPAGTTLTPYAGSTTIDKANTVIEGKTLGCVRVTAPGVVIRDSKISCADSVAVGSFDGDYSGTPLLLEDVEIDCQDGPGHAVGDALVTVRGADIHGCENGFDMNQSITVEDSYIHDLWNGSGSHMDGIQLASGHLVGSGYEPGALNITIRHNTIFGVSPDGELGTSAIISNPVGDENILIQDNLMAGGAYTLYCAYEGTATNYRVVGNHFSRRFSQKVGAFGPSDGCSDETLSGNVYHETGTPVRLD